VGQRRRQSLANMEPKKVFWAHGERRQHGVRCGDGRDAEDVKEMGNGEGVSLLPSRLGSLGEHGEHPQRGPGQSPKRVRTPLVATFVENERRSQPTAG